MTPRLLQIANVGHICGGTAACAWTVARALPGLEHTVAFFGPVTEVTRAAFAPHRVQSISAISDALLRDTRPDVVLLHNVSRARLRQPLNVPTVQYVHSRIDPAPADATVCCSHWLAAQLRLPAESVLWQAVPRAVAEVSRSHGEHRPLIVGRLCTPQARKWPDRLVTFYARLARTLPTLRWEFVGCPVALQAGLAESVGQRATFWPAGWQQRGLLARWDILLYHQPDLPESFGRTVAEAMRIGCIPVVDRQGGFIEQLATGGGYLCTTPDDFLNALQTLQDPAIRQAVSQTATTLADQNWSLAPFARRLLDLFDTAATKRPARPRLH